LAFLDWLAEAGLRYWQVLPVGPPDPSGSPYSALSDRAGNPAWVAAEGQEDGEEFDIWRRESHWLEDWALFAALKERFGGAAWWRWEPALMRREPAALAAIRQEMGERIEAHARAQFRFHRAWQTLRQEAHHRGICLIGDLPMYPALDSAEVWARPDLFELDADLRPLAVAGCPPDYFNQDGQHWGNPLYRWPRHRDEGYAWWIERVRHQLGLFDGLRLDHFRGFASYWRIPAQAATAAEGAWVPGPGLEIFEALRAELSPESPESPLPLILEDLGELTPDVAALREVLNGPAWRIPTMGVLQFGFDDGSDHAAHRLTPTQVVYTGTHDNNTSAGWYASLPPQAQERVRLYTGCGGCTPEGVARALVRLAFTSVADTAIVPLQDVLGLGEEARMNLPGTAEGNWGWRLAEPPLLEAARALRRLVEVSERLGGEG
jgi:4-alpha-glucanotransferase